MRRIVFRFIAVSAALTAACSKTETAKVDTSAPSATPAPAPSAAAAPTADSMVLVRGTIATASETQLVVKTDSASVTVNMTSPVQVFSREKGDLTHVAQNSFIGVTTVKQPDGSEQATEIHIFPEELRGLGEGSRMMNAPAGASGGSGNRMTNGAVSTPQMTNGTTASKMSNGAVSSTNGSTLVVQYPGGSTTVTVPPKTPVTEIKATPKKPAVGDQVVVVAKRGADGALTSQKVLMAK